MNIGSQRQKMMRQRELVLKRQTEAAKSFGVRPRADAPKCTAALHHLHRVLARLLLSSIHLRHARQLTHHARPCLWRATDCCEKWQLVALDAHRSVPSSGAECQGST